MSVKVITKDNFENEVMHSEKPVLLDFWAAWCGPCKMLSPLVDKYSEEDSSVKVGKVNVDEENELASAFGISSIPALFVVKHGKVVASTVGYMPEEELKSFVASAKAKAKGSMTIGWPITPVEEGRTSFASMFSALPTSSQHSSASATPLAAQVLALPLLTTMACA